MGSDVVHCKVLNYLNLNLNWSAIEHTLVDLGTIRFVKCVIRSFPNKSVCWVDLNQLTFLQLQLWSWMFDIHSIYAQTLPYSSTCTCFFLCRFEKKKNHFQRNCFPQCILSCSILPALVLLLGIKWVYQGLFGIHQFQFDCTEALVPFQCQIRSTAEQRQSDCVIDKPAFGIPADMKVHW